jgi:hypothetical protein
VSEEPTQIPADAPAPSGATRVDVPPPENGASGTPEVVDEHPEILVAGAFAGAWLFAKILKRIGGS